MGSRIDQRLQGGGEKDIAIAHVDGKIKILKMEWVKVKELAHHRFVHFFMPF